MAEVSDDPPVRQYPRRSHHQNKLHNNTEAVLPKLRTNKTCRGKNVEPLRNAFTIPTGATGLACPTQGIRKAGVFNSLLYTQDMVMSSGRPPTILPSTVSSPRSTLPVRLCTAAAWQENHSTVRPYFCVTMISVETDAWIQTHTHSHECSKTPFQYCTN